MTRYRLTSLGLSWLLTLGLALALPALAHAEDAEPATAQAAAEQPAKENTAEPEEPRPAQAAAEESGGSDAKSAEAGSATSSEDAATNPERSSATTDDKVSTAAAEDAAGGSTGGTAARGTDDRASQAQANEAAGVLTSSAPAVRGTEPVEGSDGQPVMIPEQLATPAGSADGTTSGEPGSAEPAATESPSPIAALSTTPSDPDVTCGSATGPTGHAGVPYCFRGPTKIVVGEPIVIEGISGYLATDDRTGSVVNFFFDAEYSGDPNTVYSKQQFTNPATGAPIGDRRTNAIVQADGGGAWRVEIPWPTVHTISTTSNGQGSYTQAALDAKFAPGTTHSIRMLTGSLLSDPPDRVRGESLYFTVVGSAGEDVGITEPVYEHQTFTSAVPGDRAVAWLRQQVSSGQSIALTGTGWLTTDGAGGSTLTVRLQDETGAYYRRAGSSADPHADAADPTVWQVIQAPGSGELDTRIALPSGVAGGDFVAVELTTVDDLSLGDVARHWVSAPVVVDNAPYVPAPGEDATCTAAPGAASYDLAPGMKVPAANVGGTIRLTGTDWCNLVGGGSLIAVKIDDGAYSRLASQTAPMFDANSGREVGECPAAICASNKTIWYTIEADAYGSFDAEIPLPTRTNSAPGFGEGSYTLRLMTHTLGDDPYYQGSRPDPSRTMKTPGFTVVAEGQPLEDVKPGQPSATPDPLHATDDLTKTTRGGVTVDQRAKRWLVTIPAAAAGDWVYVNVYDAASPRFPWGNRWFEVDADHRVSLPLAKVTLPSGANKLSVQDRDGGLLGWAMVTVAAPRESAARPAVVVTPIRYTSATVGKPKPTAAPAQPVPGYADLGDAGTVTATASSGRLTVTVPAVAGGDWVYLYLYTETGRVVGVDWVQVGSDHSFTVAIGKLPDGSHRLALVDTTGKLLGWVVADGPAPLPDAEPEVAGETIAGGAGEPSSGGSAPAQPTPAAPVAGDNGNATLILVGLAFLVLAGSAAGVIALQTPVHPATASKGRP